MASPVAPWPCPICAELVTIVMEDCPHCRAEAGWIDLLRALDFSIRQFHYWSLTGTVTKDEYRAIVDACRQRREDMSRQAQMGAPSAPEPTLPPQTHCWSCQTSCRPNMSFCGSCGAPLVVPEVRLLRYHTYLCGEITAHRKQSRLDPKKSQQLLEETLVTLEGVRQRLESARPI